MLNDDGGKPLWYLLKTKSRQERRAKDNLERQGIEVFCPEITVEKVRSGKSLVESEILFPRYLFIKLWSTSPSVGSIRSTKGVQSFISFGGTLAKVPLSLIVELKNNTESNGQTVISKLPRKGDKLHVKNGSFKGINVVFSQPDGERRAVVLMKIMNQEIKMSVRYSDLSIPTT